MKKKGISPLIATVLIIGFTVALAAIIITWSTGFTKKMQATTEETANVQVICATDVIFDLKNVCKSGSDFNVLIQNDGSEPIESWKVRVYESESIVKPLDKGPSVPAFGVDTIKILGTDLSTGTPVITKVKKIEAFPIIKRGGKLIVCSQNTDSYGDASSTTDITTAC